MNHERAYGDSERYDEIYPKLLKPHKKIFLGHTNTLFFKSTTPINPCNVFNLDTAAGYKGGKLTMMDADTNEYWQSNLLAEYYPNDPHTLYGRQ